MTIREEILNNTKNQKSLKACPFCGGDAELKQTGKMQMTVRCKKCLTGLTQKVLRNSLEWLESKLIESWNTRQSERRLKEIAEKAYDAGRDFEYNQNFGRVPNPSLTKNQFLSSHGLLTEEKI